MIKVRIMDKSVFHTFLLCVCVAVCVSVCVRVCVCVCGGGVQ